MATSEKMKTLAAAAPHHLVSDDPATFPSPFREHAAMLGACGAQTALVRSVEDLALSFDAMQRWDPDDPVCTDRPAEPTASPLTSTVSWRGSQNACAATANR